MATASRYSLYFLIQKRNKYSCWSEEVQASFLIHTQFSLFACIIPNSHPNIYVYKIAFSLVKYFRWYGPRESLPSSFVCSRGHEFLLVCMRLEFKSIIPMSVQHIIFVGEVFQIEISDGLVHPLGSR